MKRNETYCPKCDTTTQSIIMAKLKYVCRECGHDKTMSDLYYMEKEK